MPRERIGPGALAGAAEAKGNNSDRSFSPHAAAWGAKPATRGSGNRAGIGYADQRSDTAPARRRN
jgi:hypothetical protein